MTPDPGFHLVVDPLAGNHFETVRRAFRLGGSRGAAVLAGINAVGKQLPRVDRARAGLRRSQDPKIIKKPAFYAGLVEALGRFRMLSDDLNGGAGGNRTPVHKSYATRSTYVAQSIVLTAHYPTGRESAQPAR